MDKIFKLCEGKNIVEVLVTHFHFDHIGALKAIEEKYNLKANEKSGCFDYETILTPGHTSDSKCFYFREEKIIFSGDFLFAGTIGRTDLDTGSDDDMKQSLNLISKYDDDIIIYPGHGPITNLKTEKSNFKYY